MKLIACPSCHAQYDVTTVGAREISCACGQTLDNVSLAAVDAPIHRCGSCGASVLPDAAICDYCESSIVRDRKQLSLVCPECYGRNAEGSRFCTGCGVEFRPQVLLLDDDGTLSCPSCETTLESRSVGGIGVRECPACNGFWVPGGNFDSLVERAIEAQRSQGFGMDTEGEGRRTAFQSTVVYRKCPECGATMQRKNFARRSGVIVDWCGNHGTWLDADELEDIAAFVLRGGLAGQAPAAGDWRQPADPDRVKKMAALETMRAEADRRRLRMERTGTGVHITVDGAVETILGLFSRLLD